VILSPRYPSPLCSQNVTRAEGGRPTRPPPNMRAFKAELLKEYEELPACFETSVQPWGQGRAELLNYLAQLRRLEETQGGENTGSHHHVCF